MSVKGKCEKLITVPLDKFSDVTADSLFTVEVTENDGGLTERFVDCPVISVGEKEFTVSIAQ